jgi:hypothetical protein
MSQFAPTQWTLEPQPRPDHLSAAVLHSLSRPFYGLAWGPIKSLVLGGITFGILPLISWPRKFHRYLLSERRQLWHLVEWLRISAGEEQAADLTHAMDQTRPAPTLWIIPAVVTVILAANFLSLLHGRMFRVERILSATYLFGFSGPITASLGPFRYWPPAAKLHVIWTAGLSIAFASHWLHVQHHYSTVNRLLRRLNGIFQRQQIPPVTSPALGLGLRPLWIVAAIIGCLFNAWWAIPAALAGAVHKRYIERTGARIRGDLAQRVQMMLEQRRPALDVPTPHGSRSVCPNELCAKPAPDGAAFCRRCGTRLASRFEAVA